MESCGLNPRAYTLVSVALSSKCDGCRLWDIDRDENYLLGLKMKEVIDSTETICCVAFCQAKGSTNWYCLRTQVMYTYVKLHYFLLCCWVLVGVDTTQLY